MAGVDEAQVVRCAFGCQDTTCNVSDAEERGDGTASRSVRGYRPHGSLARVLYDKRKADEWLEAYDKRKVSPMTRSCSFQRFLRGLASRRMTLFFSLLIAVETARRSDGKRQIPWPPRPRLDERAPSPRRSARPHSRVYLSPRATRRSSGRRLGVTRHVASLVSGPRYAAR